MDLAHRDQKVFRLANHPHNMLENVVEQIFMGEYEEGEERSIWSTI